MAFGHRRRPFPFRFTAFDSVTDKKPLGCDIRPWCTRQRFQSRKWCPVTMLIIIQASIYIYINTHTHTLVLHLNYTTHIWLSSYNASSSGTVRDILILCNQSFSKQICMEIESFRWNLIHADAIEMRSSFKTSGNLLSVYICGKRDTSFPKILLSILFTKWGEPRASNIHALCERDAERLQPQPYIWWSSYEWLCHCI